MGLFYDERLRRDIPSIPKVRVNRPFSRSSCDKSLFKANGAAFVTNAAPVMCVKGYLNGCEHRTGTRDLILIDDVIHAGIDAKVDIGTGSSEEFRRALG